MSEQQPLPPVKLAFILDGKVLDVLHTDDRLAAIFLSEPLVLEVSEKIAELTAEDPKASLVNWTFDGKDFIPPAEQE